MNPISLMSRFIGTYRNRNSTLFDIYENHIHNRDNNNNYYYEDTVGSSTLIVVNDDDSEVSRINSSSSSVSSNSTKTRRITLMDFFDVRKFQSHRDFVFNDGRLQAVSDYSIIALLPVILVAFLIAAIFFIYRFRKWKHNKKQLAELDAFYDIVESSPCLSGKPYLMKHVGDHEKSSSHCDQITQAVTVPTNNSIFFQPIPPKTKSVRCTGQVLKAVNASEVIFHFAHLPTPEKLKKSTVLVHRV